MKCRSSRWSHKWVGLVGFLLLVFGLLCLNYTKAENVVRHTASAARLGIWPPSPTILWTGVACLALGSGLIGSVIGRMADRNRSLQHSSETRL